MISLGQKVKMKTTGIAGVVAARAEYLHGTPRIVVEYATTNGKHTAEWLNEEEVVPVEAEG